MVRLKDISFRYKIPLRSSLLVFLTATILSGSLLLREYRDLRGDLIDTSRRWSSVLSQTLVSPLLHDDLWRAFELIRAAADPHGEGQASAITVLDADRNIYVSTAPERYRMTMPLHEQGSTARELAYRIASADTSDTLTLELNRRLYLVTPINADGVRLGHMILEQAPAFMQRRFTGMWLSASAVTLLVMALILPISWYWGNRMAEPLVRLAACMRQVGSERPDPQRVPPYDARDEIGQVSCALTRMLEELQRKQALEQEFVFTERLAAIGRLTGSIAHEINNPLGGMLNAINTYRRHADSDPQLAARTLSLLERGLTQIRDTVSALLVEAKAPSHQLRRHDIDDIQILLKPEAEKRRALLHWQCLIPEQLPLPSTLVRQVLINLVLNALQAVEEGGRVLCEIGFDGDTLHLMVRNDGHHIDADRLPYLFEPYVNAGDGGHGLGLWITYQIVHRMEGHIAVRSEPGDTLFVVKLPATPSQELPS